LPKGTVHGPAADFELGRETLRELRTRELGPEPVLSMVVIADPHQSERRKATWQISPRVPGDSPTWAVAGKGSRDRICQARPLAFAA
jgi:hypothetical protein